MLLDLHLPNLHLFVWLKLMAMERLDSGIPGTQQWEKQFLQIIYKSHWAPDYSFISKETPDLPLLVFFSKFHGPAEAWQSKLHRLLPMEHFCILNSSLQTVSESSAPRPHQHKTLKGESGDWQLSSLETFNDVFSVYSFTVLTWAINICRTCFSWQKCGIWELIEKVNLFPR